MICPPRPGPARPHPIGSARAGQNRSTVLIAIWIFIVALIGLWSLTAWGLYTLLSANNAWLGDLKPLLDQMPFGPWLERWLPGWRALAEFTIDAVQAGLGVLGGAAPVIVWAVWGAGTIALTLVGALLSMLVTTLRDKPRARPPRPIGR